MIALLAIHEHEKNSTRTIKKKLWERNKGDLDSLERLIPRTPDAATKQQLEIQAADKRRGLTEIEGQIDAIMKELGET